MEQSEQNKLRSQADDRVKILRPAMARPGLKFRLMVWFSLVALLPVMFLALVFEPMLKTELGKTLDQNMKVVIALKKRNVEQYFNEIIELLLIEARRPTNRILLVSLSDGLAQSGQAPKDYVGGEDWKSRIILWKDQTGREGMKTFRNVMLTDLTGHILYAPVQQRRLGMNVFRGDYVGTRLFDAARRALDTTDAIFSDYDLYNADGSDRVFGHMVIRMHDRWMKPIGLLVFQFDGAGINGILGGHPDPGQTFEMYLVGKDLRLRTDAGKRRERKALKHQVTTGLLRFSPGSRGDNAWERLPLLRYIGPDNVAMIGTRTGVRIGQVDYHLIAEIEEREAFKLLQNIRRGFVLTAGVLVCLIMTVSIFFAGGLVRQMLALTEWAKNVATGDLGIWDTRHRDDELGQFIDSFRQVVLFMKETSRLALSVASGDFRADIEPRSAHDELGAALAQMTRSLREVVDAMEALAGGDFDVRVRVKGPNDLFAKSVNRMVLDMKQAHEAKENQTRLKSLQMELSEIMRGDQATHDLAGRILSFFCTNFGASVGAFYIADENQPCLYLYGCFACGKDHHVPPVICPGEGLPGQAMVDKKPIVLNHCATDEMVIHGLVEDYTPESVLVFPFVRENHLEAVIEMGSLAMFTDQELDFLEQVSESVSVALNSAMARVRMEDLLDKTTRQAEDLKINQEKLDGINRDLQAKTLDLQRTEARLRAANLDLTHQTEKLRDSEKRLRQKEEELIAANTALEERSMNLEDQKNAIKEKNIQLENTQKELLEKSRWLEDSSRYKSEFLANMSHELRTPLNSILLISRLLAENKWGNLNGKQVEFARTVQAAGKDLLALIDDILDLSKIESGKLEIHISPFSIRGLQQKIKGSFKPVCREKGIDWLVEVDADVPDKVYMDVTRVDQVLKNLVSNAVKFTARGRVRVHIRIPEAAPPTLGLALDARDILLIDVEDTGIGIEKDKQALIFEAFKQADGTISREFGGTGLGLSISRQLIRLMGGDIVVESQTGRGSVFRVYLPGVFAAPTKDELFSLNRVETPPPPFPETGSRQNHGSAMFSGKTVLIVDDDMRNVYALMHSLGDYGLAILVARTGRQCLAMLEKNPATDLVIMDIMMPDMGGFEAMERMRADRRFKGIPVIAITAKAMKGDRETCLQAGASEYLSKPVDMDRLLTVMKDMLT